MAEKHSAPLTSYNAFFHGLGQLRPRRQPRLNDRSRFSEETFAGAHANRREAPKPNINPETTAPPSLTQSGLLPEKGTLTVRLERYEGLSLRIVSVRTAMI